MLWSTSVWLVCYQNNTVHSRDPGLLYPQQLIEDSRSSPNRTRYVCLSEFKIWQNFCLWICCAVCNIMLYCTMIYQESIIMCHSELVNICLFQFWIKHAYIHDVLHLKGLQVLWYLKQFIALAKEGLMSIKTQGLQFCEMLFPTKISQCKWQTSL